MTRSTIARVSGAAVGIAMVLGFAGTTSAVTIAELQAQIAALMAQLTALQGGSSAGVTITRDLTVGSTGADVTGLQTTLIANGYSIPAGATGYFGSQTKAAVMAWQAAVGLPSTGFFGPLSRAKFGGSVTGGTTTGGVTTGGTTTTGGLTGITTPGAEGTLSVTSAPVSNSTVYEGDVGDAVLAFNAKSTGSDVALQRVKIDLGSSTTLYNKVISNVSLVDDQGRVLAQSDTNSSTVVKDSDNRYYLTLSGFSSVVAKGTQRTYTIKVNVRDSASADASTGTIRLAANGVRAIDGAGIDLYSPTNATDVTRTFTVSASLADSASLTVALNTANPLAQEVVAAAGSSSNELDKMTVLVFDITAEKDNATLTDLTATVTASGGSGLTASTTYLFAGNGTSGTPIASASLSGSSAAFTNMAYSIPKGTTKTFTLAVDIRSANTTQTTVTGTVTGSTSNVVATNGTGDTIGTVSGTASGNSMLVRKVGPQFSLVGTPTITRTTASVSTNSTSTATATFQLRIQAVGESVVFGTLSSTTPLVTNGTSNVGAASFVIYKNGSSDASNVKYASSTDFSVPTGYTASSENVTITKGNSVTIPVTFWFQAKTTAGVDSAPGSYAIALERINWLSSSVGLTSSTFMAGKTEWRTPAVALP